MDLKQFNQFYNEKQGGFKRFAASYVHDEMTAEDIVSELFAYYWDNRHTLSEDANVAAYVLTVVKHKCLDYPLFEPESYFLTFVLAFIN